MSLCIFIQHLPIGPVALDLKHTGCIIIYLYMTVKTSEMSESYLFKGPFIMGIFRISVDKGIQSLWDDGAVLGEAIRLCLAFFSLQTDTLQTESSHSLLLCGLYWFRVKVSLCVH